MRVLFGLIVCFVGLEIQAQTFVEQYLGAPVYDQEYQRVQMTEDFIQENGFNSPWLREMEFRLRTDDANIGIEEYRLRLGLINPMEVRANKAYSRLITSQSQAINQKALNDVLLRRYEMVLEHAYLYKQLTNISDELADNRSIRRLILNTDQSVKALMELDQQNIRLILDSMENIRKIGWVENVLEQAGVQNTEWEEFGFISNQDLMAILASIDSAGVNPIMDEAAREKAIEEQLLAIEKAEAFSNIGFIQGEYDTNQGGAFSNHLGFQFGISIPIFNTDRPDIQRRRLNMIEEQVEFLSADREFSYKWEGLKVELVLLMDKLSVVEQSISQLDTYRQLIEKTPIRMENFLEYADYKRYLRDEALKLQSDVRMKFIRMLHLSESLSRPPLQNYLSAELTPYDMQ